MNGTPLSSEQHKEISRGNKPKVARVLVLLICVGDERKEVGKSKASEKGRLGIDKAGIAESPKRFPTSVVTSRGKVTQQSRMCFL